MRKLLSLENLTLIALGLGFLGGLYFPEVFLNIKILGDIFLALLKMIIVPLVFFSVFSAMLGLGSVSKFKDMGLKTVAYYFSTTALAVASGILVVSLMDPGKGAQIQVQEREPVEVKELTFEDIVWSIVPTNIAQSFAEGKVLHIILFAVLLGLATLTIGKRKRETIGEVFEGLSDALVVLTGWIVKLTPIGVFSLVGYVVASEGVEVFLSLWEYVLAVILGLGIHALITLPILAFLIGRYNPYAYFLKVREAPLLAFSTASSAATLPVSMKVAEEKGGVSKETAGFVLPLGATINMDGTALYESVAAVFIANLFGVELGFSQILTIFLTATLASIGAAAIPGAGLVMLTLVLSSVGLPLEGIALILAVDRFLDMIRTAVNVWGDLNGAKIVDRLVKSRE